MSFSTLYSNVPLASPEKQIRLLRIQPGNPEDIIICRLEAYDLDENGLAYIAISYTWGDSIPTVLVKINGSDIAVQLNCWHTLWQMRLHSHTDHIWIDSICIAQTNDREKSIQVARMGNIFQAAKFVAACLGQGSQLQSLQASSKDPGLASQALKEIAQMPYFNRIWIKQELVLARNIILFCGVDSIPWQEVVDANHLTKTIVKRVTYPLIKDEPSDGTRIARLCVDRAERLGEQPSESPADDRDSDANWDADSDNDEPYMTESEDYDPEEADYGEGLEEIIGDPYDMDESSGGSDAEYFENALAGQDEDKGDKNLSSTTNKNLENRSTLTELLKKYGDAKCTDVRDKVYALLPLASQDDIAREYITVDYSKTLLEFISSVLKVVFYSSPKSNTFTTFEKIHCVQQWFSNHIKETDVQDYLQKRAMSHLPTLVDAEADVFHHLPRLTITHWIYLLDPSSSAYLNDINWYSELPLKVRWPQYHFGMLALETTPETSSESNTDTRSNQAATKRELEEYRRKEQNVIYAFRRSIFPPYEEITNQWEPTLIAGSDVHSGDVVVSVSWPTPTPTVDINVTKETSSYAILRRRKDSEIFDFCGWAKPYSFGQTGLFVDVEERFPTRLDIGGLYLHLEDMSSFMLLNRISSSSNWLDLAAVKMARGSYASFANYELGAISKWLECLVYAKAESLHLP
ncbi:hypothetical protein B7494_g8332 [Chlorociboria aeruginascens]|nr:hypothetical protein B7494_g8332 [Chlorociboria aeruginascens]